MSTETETNRVFPQTSTSVLLDVRALLLGQGKDQPNTLKHCTRSEVRTGVSVRTYVVSGRNSPLLVSVLVCVWLSFSYHKIVES